MKKILSSVLTTILTVGCLLGASAGVAEAASQAMFSLTPAQITVRPGQAFTVSVYINPLDATRVYTAKLLLRYPSNLLQVTSYTPNSAFISLTQTGYDLTDNTTGSLIKTVGIPGGNASSTLMGTITFQARAAGLVSLDVINGSAIYDVNNLNVITSIGTKSTVTVSGTPISGTGTTGGTGGTAGGTGTTGTRPSGTTGTGTGIAVGTQTGTTTVGGIGGPDEGIGEGFALNPENQSAAVGNWFGGGVGRGLLVGMGVLLLIILAIYLVARKPQV